MVRRFSWLVVFFAILAALPFGMGWLGERSVIRFVDHVGKKGDAAADIRIVSYQRGWFTSSAVFEVRFNQANQWLLQQLGGKPHQLAVKPLVLQIKGNVTHGPLLFYRDQASSGLKFGVGQAFIHSTMPLLTNMQELMGVFSRAPASGQSDIQLSVREGGVNSELSVDSQVSLLGNSEHRFMVRPFQLNVRVNDASGVLQWKGLKGQFSVNSKFNQFDTQLTFDGSDYVLDAGANQVFHLGQGQMKSQMKKQDGLFVGSMTFSVPSVQFLETHKPTLVITGLQLKSENQVKDSTFNQNFWISLDKFAVADKQYGPGNLEFNSQVNSKALSQFVQSVSEFQSNSKNAPEPSVVLQKVLALLPSFLEKGVSYEVKTLSLHLPEGLMTASARWTVKGDPKATVSVIAPLDWFKLLGKSVAQLSAQLPENFVEQTMTSLLAAKLSKTTNAGVASSDTADQKAEQGNQGALDPAALNELAKQSSVQQLNQLVQQGFLVRTGNDLKVNASLENGQLTINGKPMFGW